MRGTELQISRIRTGVIRYKVYNNLVDIVHFSEGGKMQIPPKLDLYCTNQDQIRNQRPQLRRNTLFLVEKWGGGAFSLPVLLICI